MMREEPKDVLDDILSRWHTWAKGYSPVPKCGADPMFRQAKANRSWDSADDILESDVNNSIMQTVDFQVGEMLEPHRSAIYCLARNYASGAAVWSSPRLPMDPFERTTIVIEARNQLSRRLLKAGVL